MSPASQGALEVERYIGSCLITKVDHGAAGRGGRYLRYAAPAPPSPGHAHGPASGWAGVPLISMASMHPRRNRKGPSACTPCPKPQPGTPPSSPPQLSPSPQHSRSPLSRLAIHTQGAPLILAGRYLNNGRKNGHLVGQPNKPGATGPSLRLFHSGDVVRRGSVGKDMTPTQPQPKQPATNVPSSDTLSVASDESSGHSENSLPRIIKPRKRRKKDRKPPPLTAAAPEPVPTVSLKAIAYKGAEPGAAPKESDEPKLSHEFEDVKEHDDEGSDRNLLLCQCRYCDPAGLIWDVDQNCYSPFLTPPSASPSHLGSFPLFLSPTESRIFPDLYSRSGEEMSSSPASLPAVSARNHSDLVLRRSWSEPSPSRKDSERADSLDGDRRTPPTHQGLEVSSEIVTSHNGHRDIEIKFFSSVPSPSPSTLGPLADPEE